MAKVYVSSTVADLKAERHAVMEWLRAARHQAVDSYLPDSDTVRESCLDDIDECDLYVLILGHRYGHQPDDAPDGLSIMHLEFRRAVVAPARAACLGSALARPRRLVPSVFLEELDAIAAGGGESGRLATEISQARNAT